VPACTAHILSLSLFYNNKPVATHSYILLRCFYCSLCADLCRVECLQHTASDPPETEGKSPSSDLTQKSDCLSESRDKNESGLVARLAQPLHFPQITLQLSIAFNSTTAKANTCLFSQQYSFTLGVEGTVSEKINQGIEY